MHECPYTCIQTCKDRSVKDNILFLVQADERQLSFYELSCSITNCNWSICFHPLNSPLSHLSLWEVSLWGCQPKGFPIWCVHACPLVASMSLLSALLQPLKKMLYVVNSDSNRIPAGQIDLNLTPKTNPDKTQHKVLMALDLRVKLRIGTGNHE